MNDDPRKPDAPDRVCNGNHPCDAYEAEDTERFGLAYIVLRCPACERVRGYRLARDRKGQVSK